MDSDAELLHAFIETRSNEAFATLVRRHLPVVYGAALRRVGGNVHRAQDISQLVFTTLAQKAGSLRGHPVLTGWLYSATNNFAAKTMRTEIRRSIREQTAQAIAASEDVRWDSVRPEIDDAMLELSEGDRVALLLRYFQDETYPVIGARLGITDNGARMRTEHALESLRTGLAKRGITSTAAAIGGALVANGAVIAPGGMAAAIAANATLTASGGLLLFMSTSTFKTGAVVVALIAGATGLFIQSRTNNELLAETASLRAKLAEKDLRDIANFRNANATTQGDQAEIDRLRAEVARLNELPPPNATMAAWAMRLASLKQRMAQLPDQNIPEMRFLTEDDWLDASRQKLDTEEDYRKAMAKLRGSAEKFFAANLLQPALKRFVQANGNQMPADLGQLQAYFSETIEPAILQRWDVLPSSAIPSVRLGGDSVVSQKAPVDGVYDMRLIYGANSNGGSSWPTPESTALQAAVAAFRAANNGQAPTAPVQLLPYAATPEQQSAVQKMISDVSKAGASSGGGAARP